MTAFLEAWRRLLALIGRVERVLVILLILAIVVSIGVQVISRYLFDRPLVWVEELATYSFIWATFLGASLGLKHDRHIRIQTFVGKLPAPLAALVRVVGHLAVLCLAVVVMQQAVVVAGIEGRRQSISLPVALPMSLFYSIPLFIGMASMALTTLYLALVELLSLSGGPRPPAILPWRQDEEGSDADEGAMAAGGSAAR